MTDAGERAAWTPPRDPDPRQILNEAREDADGLRYADALAKHVWFHENALKYRASLYGVRLSFALSDWFRLARLYPPARAALEKARDEAAGRLAQRNDAFMAFNDLASINRVIGEESRTKAEFLAVDRDDPALARTLFPLARPALIRAKEYALCGKYLRPNEDVAHALAEYRQGRQWEKEERFGSEFATYVAARFTSETATLVALLVLNGRDQEAQTFAGQVRKEWNDGTFHAALDAALRGQIPEPWP